MFAFVVYAVVFWYLAAKHRRRWRGFACVGAAVVGLAFVAFLHWQLNVWTQGRIFLRVMQIMLYPYTVVVAAVGLYIASLPRAIRSGVCHRCGYDLAGLPMRNQPCPECGVPVASPAVEGRCAVCHEDVARQRRRFGQCTRCRTPFRFDRLPPRPPRRRERGPAPRPAVTPAASAI